MDPGNRIEATCYHFSELFYHEFERDASKIYKNLLNQFLTAVRVGQKWLNGGFRPTLTSQISVVCIRD